jgi:hypothetical protein
MNNDSFISSTAASVLIQFKSSPIRFSATIGAGLDVGGGIVVTNDLPDSLKLVSCYCDVESIGDDNGDFTWAIAVGSLQNGAGSAPPFLGAEQNMLAEYAPGATGFNDPLKDALNTTAIYNVSGTDVYFNWGGTNNAAGNRTLAARVRVYLEVVKINH